MSPENEPRFAPSPYVEPQEAVPDMLFAALLPQAVALEEISQALDSGDGRHALTLAISPVLSQIAGGLGMTPRQKIDSGTSFRESWETPPSQPSAVHVALHEAWDAYEQAKRINGIFSGPRPVDGIQYNEDEKAASVALLGYWTYGLHREIALRAEREKEKAAGAF